MIKKENSTEPGETEPSVKTKVEFENVDSMKSLNKDSTNVWGRQRHSLEEGPRKLGEIRTSIINENAGHGVS